MQFEKKELKKKSENLSDWYTDVILKAELADYAPVKGTMVIRPYGYALWEKVQEIFNGMMRTRGVENAYFPLFIPHSLLEKEKEHVEGFSPELALVTIAGGEKLKDPLVIRPTSETIMYAMYAKWVHSWRDLPVLINQWCNVVRWEKRTYLFLRTTEFLWQEGHTVHATEEEAIDMVMTAQDWYRQILEDYLAIPVYQGTKSSTEKFAGAKTTYSNEALMPDGKALQMGTSHNLGQGFAKSFNINFKDKNEKSSVPWQSSWGISTRLIGAVILMHGDDKGLILPPNVAEKKIVIVPILFKEKNKDVIKKAKEIEKKLSEFDSFSDLREEYSAGWKFNEWEMKGIPIRLEVGPNDLKKKQVVLVRRDTGKKEFVKESELAKKIPKILNDIQKSLFKKAEKFLKENIVEAKNHNDFKKAINDRKLVKVFFSGDAKTEKKVKEETGATSRCVPFNAKSGKCIFTGKQGKEIYFAKAY